MRASSVRVLQGATAFGVAIGAIGVVPPTPAGATSTNCIANVGLPSGGSLCTTAVGGGVRVDRMDYTRTAGLICNFNGGWEGTLSTGVFAEGWEMPPGGTCRPGTAGDSDPVNRDFKNKTWFRGRWKEEGQVGPGRTSHCIERNWWDFC